MLENTILSTGGRRASGVQTMRTPLEPALTKVGPMYERILVPLDGSETAETILPFVERVAGPLDAEVVLLHVIADARGEFVFATRVQAEEYLNALAERLADKGIRARTGIRFGSGSAPGAILAAAGALGR